jgi:hypothetical protein
LLVGLTIAPGSAVAQDATPAVDPNLGRDVPGPEECTVEPRSAESLAALFATPAAATPAAEPTPLAVPFAAPDGEAADPATAAELIALVRQEWACLNANDWPRAFALFSDDLIRRFFLPEDVEAMNVPPTEALPEQEQTAIFAVLDVEILPDGRAGAYVVVDTFGDPLPVEFNYYLFVETADGWLLDDFIWYDEVGQLLG